MAAEDYIDAFDDDGWWSGPRIQQAATCKHCGKSGLLWTWVSSKWRLVEADGIFYHYCFDASAAASADEFEVITENKLKAKTKTSRAKKVSKGYTTVGVRYLNGGALHKVYTYKIRKGAKVHLGQLLIGNNSICAVVEIHPTPQDTVVGVDYKFITQKVAAL